MSGKPLKAALAQQLARYRQVALRVADAGAAPDPAHVRDMESLEATLRGCAAQTPEDAEWLAAELPRVRAEVEARLRAALPGWWQNPPGWIVGTLLAPGILEQLAGPAPSDEL